MRHIIKKIVAVMMALTMVVGLGQVQPISANDNTGGSLTHNLNASQIPFIYCYTYNNGTKKLNGSDTVIPKNTYNIYVYIKSTNIDVDTSNSKITVNGQSVNVSWGTANEGYYTTAVFDVSSNNFNDINLDIKYSYKRNFSVRARKIITSNSSGGAAMEKILNNNAATYQLYDRNQKVYLEGTINTAIDSNTNFIHWKQITGDGQYITGDDTYVRNLPNGEYILMEMDSGKGLKTEDKTSTSVWLDSSHMKDTKGRKHYTFTINDETVNEWMNACVNEGQANSLFYGFYLENLKTTFNVNYNGNGNDQGMMKSHINIKENETISLKENQYVRWGYSFTGWNTVANPTQTNPGISYDDKSKMIVKEDSILYAQWKKNLKIAHNVYIQDNSKEADNIKEVAKKTAIDSKLAYNQEELNEILLKNLTNGYKYVETIIEVKKPNSDIWETYQPNNDIEDKSQVRYVLIIDKDLQITKTLSYNIEHWLEGEDAPRDTKKVSKKVWINDELTKLEVKEIVLNDYQGYEFSQYNPTDLPTTIEHGSTIKVHYKKIQAPIIPEEPTDPDTPITPEVPETPVVSEIPEIIVPSTNPIAPANPIIPVNPVVPGQDNVARNPVVNTPIEDNRVPAGNVEDETIEVTDIPQASGKNINQDAWALVNLICVFITIAIGLLTLILKHRKEEQEESLEKSNEKDIYIRRRWTKVLSTIIAIISIVVFILTENIFLPMILTDKWTTLMIAIALIQVVVYFVSRHYKNDNENKDQKVAYNQ